MGSCGEAHTEKQVLQVGQCCDHALACPRTGLLARRAIVAERTWVCVARDAVGSDGQVVPHNGLCTPRPPGWHRETGSVSPPTREVDGAALRAAERRKPATYPELAEGPQRLVLLGAEIGGRWNGGHLGLARGPAQPVPAGHRPQSVEQQCRDGRANGQACYQSPCNKQWRGRRLAAHGQLPRPQARLMPGRLSACSTMKMFSVKMRQTFTNRSKVGGRRAGKRNEPRNQLVDGQRMLKVLVWVLQVGARRV